MTATAAVQVPLLQARDVAIHFGGVQAARDISVDVFAGQHLAVIGQNGAGKSTFLNLCTGYLKPLAGHISFQGQDITGLSPRAITRLGIARGFQHPQLFAQQTVVDSLRFAVAASDQFWKPWIPLYNRIYADQAQELLRLFGLVGVAGQRVSQTSEGTRKLLDIAMALALKPRLLLLDEPTSGVSAEEKFTLMDTLTHALEERDVTAVFVEHDMEVVRRYANRVGVWVEGGILASGEPNDVLTDPRVVERVL